MYPRLTLARNLLSEDGVIFISIDDNEQANLKMICDEILGEESFVTTIHCQLSTTQGMKVQAAQNGNIVKNGEYILCYSKNGHKNIVKNLIYDYREKYDNHYTLLLKDDGTIGNILDLYNYKFSK
ncbi:MAG: DNA methyltransferase [Veillonella parvula]